MDIKRMPVVFSGHGSPMVALEDNEITRGMEAVGKQVLEEYGKPKAILAVSAHWFGAGTFTQSAELPQQIYDMYGFPDELYALKYPVKGSKELTDAVLDLLGDSVAVKDDWGIDHGTWTVLVHMFPDADIPVVQLSVNTDLSAKECYELGKKLAGLRDQGFMIFGSGNVVHNLFLVDWDNEDGTEMTHRFNDYITAAVEAGNSDRVINYVRHQDAGYAVPTTEHFLPLLYCMGAGAGDKVQVFNKICNLGSMANDWVYLGVNYVN